MNITADMPNVTKCEPLEFYDLGGYQAIIVRDVPNMAGIPSPTEYLYVMVLCPEGQGLPLFYVTAEKGMTGSVFLCTFDQDGNHSNYGADEDWSNLDSFTTAALSMLKEVI